MPIPAPLADNDQAVPMLARTPTQRRPSGIPVDHRATPYRTQHPDTLTHCEVAETGSSATFRLGSALTESRGGCVPAKPVVVTRAVLTLIERGACAHEGVDPSLFDHDHWCPDADSVVIFYCYQCPVMARCAEVVLGPSPHAAFSGIAGGMVFRNGRRVTLRDTTCESENAPNPPV